MKIEQRLSHLSSCTVNHSYTSTWIYQVLHWSIKHLVSIAGSYCGDVGSLCTVINNLKGRYSHNYNFGYSSANAIWGKLERQATHRGCITGIVLIMAVLLCEAGSVSVDYLNRMRIPGGMRNLAHWRTWHRLVKVCESTQFVIFITYLRQQALCG